MLVGTRSGLYEINGGTKVHVEGESVTWISNGWMLTEQRHVWQDGEKVADLGSPIGQCVLGLGDASLVGTSEARLMRVDASGAAEFVKGYDEVDARDEWYTPWGGPPDTRSLVLDRHDRIFASVHVGAVTRSDDGGETWTPTPLEIGSDVHDLFADQGSGVLLAPSAVGLALSPDAGVSWTVHTEGLHSTYLRSGAVVGDSLLVGAADSHEGKHAAVYRRAINSDDPFERVTTTWFPDHVDTHCLDARNGIAAFGQGDSVYVSADEGRTWTTVASGLPRITSLELTERGS